MKKGLFEIVCVVDRSGSMGVIQAEVIASLNRFLDEQKAHPGEALLTFVQFDDVYEMTHGSVPIKDVPHFTPQTYQPRGLTALLDAVGQTIDQVGISLSMMAEEKRPEKVLFAIITDGQENASKAYTREKVKAMIAHQTQKYSWDFVFLAAGPEAFAEAGGIGIKNVSAFAANDPTAYRSATQGLSDYTSSQRSGGDAQLN